MRSCKIESSQIGVCTLYERELGVIAATGSVSQCVFIVFQLSRTKRKAPVHRIRSFSTFTLKSYDCGIVV